MKKLAFACVVLLVAVVLVVVGAADAAHPQQTQAAVKMSTIAQTAEWQALKSLAGDWEGFYDVDGKKMPATVEVRLTGDGSAVMHIMGKGTPHEMVTMFHPDGRRLLATHYCAAHNQPRMALVESQRRGEIRFEYVDGTNIEPGDTHMTRLVLTIIDADHHTETWTSVTGGKETPPMILTYSRKK
jgi:hypothetical protein